MNNRLYRLFNIFLSFVFIVSNILNLINGRDGKFGAGYYLFYITVIIYIIDIFIVLLISDFKIQKVLPDFLIIFIIYFFINYEKITVFFVDHNISLIFSVLLIIFRNIYNIFSKEEILSLSKITQIILRNPAKSIISGYFISIFAGAILLILSYAVRGNDKPGFINALFTSTSAICVNGLTVIDTGASYSIFGQIVILVLIQLGGLGIMIFSSFISFLIYRRISYEDTLTLSYVLNENDMSLLFKNIKNIILTAFVIEGVGAVFLFFKFFELYGFSVKTLYYAVFHSVSAFCNAGFSLMDNSLADYSSSPLTIFTISFLIIAGGIGFSTISNIYNFFLYRIRVLTKGNSGNVVKINENSRIVIYVSISLLVCAFLVIYALEHRGVLSEMPIASQYLNAFFQSVTLRTAGFNSVDISLLNTSTYFFMIIMMYIGGASGSTAGGIKVNTIGVIIIRIKAFMQNSNSATAFNKTIDRDIVVRAFMIVFLSISLIIFSLFILTVSDGEKDFVKLLFETVSAFGTVGLSAGITSDLSVTGKLVIIILMFVGKIGPLTLFSAVSDSRKSVKINYPSMEVVIG